MNSASRNLSKTDIERLRQMFQARVREILYGPQAQSISIPAELETRETPPAEKKTERAKPDAPPARGILVRFAVFLYRNAKRCAITGFWLIAVLLFLAEYLERNALLACAFTLYGLISIPLLYAQIRHARFFPSRERTNRFLLFAFYSFLIANGLNLSNFLFPQYGLGDWSFLVLAPGYILCGVVRSFFP